MMNKCLIFSLIVLIVGLFGRPCAAAESKPGAIDFKQAQQLHRKKVAGESLTPEEEKYLKQAEQQFRQKQQQRKAQRSKPGQNRRERGPVPPAKDSTELVPLTDMDQAKYKGEDGGLYGNGSNDPPASHRAAIEKKLKEVLPRDAQGKPAADGKIVFLSVGMSNTTMEYQAFKREADADPRKSPNVVIIDGAQGGHDGAIWAYDGRRAIADAYTDRSDPWPVLDQRLKSAGVSPEQVQVAWIKHAIMEPSFHGDFPKHAQFLADTYILTLQKLHDRFPHLRVAYLSSRTYAGYATSSLNPEPYAYESAFAVRWVIEKQIQGDPRLNFDPAQGAVKSPIVLWGPYLWTDGIKPRQVDQLVWLKSDVRTTDYTHPDDSGRAKVAQLLLDFVHNNPLASCWYLKK